MASICREDSKQSLLDLLVPDLMEEAKNVFFVEFPSNLKGIYISASAVLK